MAKYNFPESELEKTLEKAFSENEFVGVTKEERKDHFLNKVIKYGLENNLIEIGEAYVLTRKGKRYFQKRFKN
jgi:hypothetical protein